MVATFTTYTNTSVSTDSTPTDFVSSNEFLISDYTTYTTYTSSIYYDEKLEKNLKKIKKRELLEHLKTYWSEKVIYNKPLKSIRPSIRLRGVRFDGRGWA